MKTLSITLLALLLLGACKEEKADRYFSSSSEIDQTKALIGDYEKGDWTAWKSHYADTAKVYHNATKAITVDELGKGFEQSTAVYQTYGFQEKDQYFEMIVDDKNEKWVNFWGNWQGSFNEKDTSIVIPVHITLQFRDGKIVEEHAFYDTYGMAVVRSQIQAEKMASEMPEDQ